MRDFSPRSGLHFASFLEPEYRTRVPVAFYVLSIPGGGGGALLVCKKKTLRWWECRDARGADISRVHRSTAVWLSGESFCAAGGPPSSAITVFFLCTSYRKYLTNPP